MGGSSSPPPTYIPPPPTPPDPFATAQAQQGYNINSAIAQNQLNNVNQITPYGNITYEQTGGSNVGAIPATPGTGPTGGYWNGFSWVPTGGTPGTPGTPGQFVPRYTATTTLNPQLQGIVNTTEANAQGNANLESGLLKNVAQTANKPLDLSWGNIANNIYGLEKNTLDPQWQQAQQVENQQLADQGLTPGSQGYGYQQTQFGLNKSNAYNQAMLQAQQQAVQDLTTQYNSPLNALTALRGNTQVAQPGVGQTAATGTAGIAPAPYAGIATSNYATGSQALTAAEQIQQSGYQAQQQSQNALMGGLFGLGGQLLGGLGGLISDRRDKTDITPLGKDDGTDLPMYAYRYKDDPKTYPKIVGPMAQDVEKAAPGSTTEVGGHMVIKSEAAQRFGLGGAKSAGASNG